MTYRRRLWIALATLLALLSLALLVLVATPLGTRALVGIGQRLAGDAVALHEPGGTLLSGITVGALAAPADGSGVTAEAVALNIALGKLVGGVLEINEIRARSLVVRVQTAADESSDGAVAWPAAPLPLAVNRVDIASLTVATTDAATGLRVRGQLTWRDENLSVTGLAIGHPDFSVDGDIAVALQPEGRIDARLAWRVIATEPALHGELHLGGTLAEVEIAHTLRAPVTVRSEGRAIVSTQSIDLVHRWLAQPLAALAQPTLTLAAGELSTRGNASAIDWALAGAITRSGDLATSVQADGTASPDALVIDTLRLDDAMGGGNVVGRIEWPDGRWQAALALDGDIAALPDFDLQLPAPIAITGDVAARQSVTAGVEANADFRPRDGADGHIAGRADWSAAGLRLDDLTLTVGTDALRIAGSLVDRNIDARLEWQIADLSRYAAPLSGALNGTGRIGGTTTQPTVALDAAVSALAASDIAVASASLRLSLDAAGTVRGRTEFFGTAIGQRPIGDWTVTVDGQMEQHRWSISGRNQDLALTMQAQGGLDAATYRLAWDAFEVIEPRFGTWRLGTPKGTLTLSATAVELSTLCLADSGSACVEGRWDRSSAAGTGKLTLDGLPIDGAMQWLFPNLESRGRMNATLRGDWQDGTLDGAARVSIADGQVSFVGTDPNAAAGSLAFAADVEASIENNSALLAARLDVAEAGGWTIDGRIADISDGASPVDLDVLAQFPDVSVLDPWLSGVRLAQGAVRLGLDVAGNLAAPSASATLTLTDFDGRIGATGTRIGDVAVSLDGAVGADWRLNADGVVGGGRLRADGQLQWPSTDDWRADLRLTGEPLTLTDLPELRVVVAPTLRMMRAPDRWLLGGELVVPEALLSPIEVPPEATLPSNDVVLHTADSAGDQATRRPLELDLRLTLGDAVQLDGYGLSARLAGALKLQGQAPDNWRAFGNLRLVDGTFEAYGQALTIDQGEMIFAGDPINPGLNFVATRDVEPGVVGIRVGGTVQAPLSTVTSTPTLPQAEALAWLISGRGLSASDSAQDDLLSQAAVGLGLTRLGTVTERLRASLGLDALVVDGGADDGQLLAGKWIGERLYLQYAVGIFDKIGSVLIRYRLSDRLRLESRTGTEQSLDLVYSVGRERR